MVTGQTPFRGRPAEVMYQHRHAPFPFEQLTDVPQPVNFVFWLRVGSHFPRLGAQRFR
jgi:hypothetical protein